MTYNNRDNNAQRDRETESRIFRELRNNGRVRFKPSNPTRGDRDIRGR